MPITDYFPMPKIRDQQRRALEWIERAVDKGFDHIVLAAPTGFGKSACAICFSNWIASRTDIAGERGAYYLVTQKMLQDQLENDQHKLIQGRNSLESIKTAGEYPCHKYKNCGVGLVCKKKGKCDWQSCTYNQQKLAFAQATTAVTNYAYLLTERAFSGKLPVRKGLVADETHTVSGQILNFVEVAASDAFLEEYAPELSKVPRGLETLQDFAAWVRSDYIPAIESQNEINELLAESDDEYARLFARTDQYLIKLRAAIDTIGTQSEWVFWSDKDRKGKLVYTARPVDSGPFANQLLLSAGTVKLYMSAYPGSLEVFCRDLGLQKEDVAWANMGSTFPIENRKFIVAPMGSMSRANKQSTLPAVLRTLSKLVEGKHRNEKGLIHAISYELADAIYDHLRKTTTSHLLLYPKSAEEREEAFNLHKDSKQPSILISPSMTEGYDFPGDLCRWIFLIKTPFLSLGDKQTLARMERDPLWYRVMASSTILQSTGRGVRSDSDFCTAYCLDSDILPLLDEKRSVLPKWFLDAVIIKR